MLVCRGESREVSYGSSLYFKNINSFKKSLLKPKWVAWVAIVANKHHLYCNSFRLHFSRQEGEEETMYVSLEETKK